ncbi:MAG TPA: cytochrome c [Terracidiphilus sp.]|nr:cytochrome c [Terracidiphilus sp.]
MKNTIRSFVLLAAALCMAGSLAFAQSSGEAVYKSKCQMCHGTKGVPSAGMVKMLGVKAANDPAMKKLSVAQMEDTVKKGKGKMRPVTGLSDAQVKEVVEYFRSLG